MSAIENIQPEIKDNGLLRFLTCGSVDDGKSTLIGRLLYDTKAILVDTLHAIERTSKKRGMEAMDGPINFGQRRDWWGLLVEGYEFQPLYKNPYNPPYYKELFENYGFKNYFNQHSFIWRANVSEASERIFDRAERLLSTPGYHVENIDMNNLEDAAENFRLVYNKACQAAITTELSEIVSGAAAV